MTTPLPLLVLLCFHMCSSKESECHCKTGCNSNIKECKSCQKGWYGKYCQKQNVALNGTATQQGAYHTKSSRTDNRVKSFTADLAVDGHYTTNINVSDNFFEKPLTCSHTDDNPNAWWSVTFEYKGVGQIKYMTIYNRFTTHPKNKKRRNGMEVKVNGTRCYKWKDNETPPEISNVTCYSTLTGNVVKIEVKEDSLSLCEVQVFVCSDRWFGKDCDKQCQCHDRDEVCDKGIGTCTESGCKAGFNGTDCHQECKNGTYGRNCKEMCGQCRDDETCNKGNGTCPDGCEDGYQLVWCNSTCNQGQYGENCRENCGQCNGTCRHVNGYCTSGCLAGWNGTRCNIPLKAELAELPQQMTWVIVGIIIAFLIAGIAVIVVLVWKKRNSDWRATPETLSRPGESALIPDSDVDDVAVEDETAYAVETYVDDTYENYTSCRKSTSSVIAVDKLQQYIEQMKRNRAFKAEYMQHPYGINGMVEVGKLPENKTKNRFAALYPYDHSRVILNDGGESDYINANYIPDVTDKTRYIATQGPTVTTVNDFWRMVWHEHVLRIVMVTNLMEVNKKKCEQYWPSSETQTQRCGYISIKNGRCVSRANYNISTLTIKHSKFKEERVVTHFHFTAWPDHDVPSAPSLVSFWKKVRQMDGQRTHPLLVHCSAGVGRTGTFIALDYLMDQAQADGRVSVYQCVARQREARMNMIQTVDQYRFVHVAVLEALKSKWTLYTSAEFEKTFSCQGYSRHQEELLKKEFKFVQSVKLQLTGKAVSDALLPENMAKNKHQTILPANKFRPFLSTPVTGRSNYINAVLLPSFERRAVLVATQTPMQHTVVDFWRLVYDHDCFTIVCLDDDTDTVYPNKDTPLQSGPFIIDQSDIIKLGCFTERKMIIQNTKQHDSSRNVTQYSFKPPTSKVFRDPASLLELINKVGSIVSNVDHKILIHCPDGAGLCGVFCSVLNIVSRLKLDSDLDILLTVRELQLIRPQFIHTIAQYKFCYDIVKEYIRSSTVYANM